MTFSIGSLLQAEVEDKVLQQVQVVMAAVQSVKMDKAPLMLVWEVLKRHRVFIRPEVIANLPLLARVATVRQEQRVVRAVAAGMAAHLAHVQMAVVLVVPGMC